MSRGKNPPKCAIFWAGKEEKPILCSRKLEKKNEQHSKKSTWKERREKLLGERGRRVPVAL